MVHGGMLQSTGPPPPSRASGRARLAPLTVEVSVQESQDALSVLGILSGSQELSLFHGEMQVTVAHPGLHVGRRIGDDALEAGIGHLGVTRGMHDESRPLPQVLDLVLRGDVPAAHAGLNRRVEPDG